MTPITFPQELLDLFIGTIAADRSYPDRIKTLKACSLACKSLGTSARSHLFSSISIYHDFQTRDKVDAIVALRDALERDPQLAANVTVFEVYVKNIRWNILSTNSRESMDQAKLPEIISALSKAQIQAGENGQRLRLHTLGLGGYDNNATSWSQFHPSFQHAWKILCVSSAITTLRVRTIRKYPLLLVLECMPGLRRLEMSQSTFDSFPSHLPRLRSDVRCPRLVELRTDESISDSEAYEPQEYRSREVPQRLFSSLEVVECYLLRAWPHVYVDVVKICAPTIKTLKMLVTPFKFQISITVLADPVPSYFNRISPKYTATALPILPSIDLGALPSLRNLSFEIRHGVPYCWHRMPTVVDLLARSTPNLINTLRIDIPTDSPTSEAPNDEAEFFANLKVETFRRLDEILSGKSFTALRTLYVRLLWPALTVEIPMDNPGALPPGINVEDLRSHLPLTLHQFNQKA